MKFDLVCLLHFLITISNKFLITVTSPQWPSLNLVPIEKFPAAIKVNSFDVRLQSTSKLPLCVAPVFNFTIINGEGDKLLQKK